MGQRDLTNGENTSRRQEPTFDTYKQRAGITNDLPDGERMQRLVMLFNSFAVAAVHCSENLQPGDLQKRIGRHDGVPSSVEEMMRFQDAGTRAVAMMKECLAEMDALPCSRINGASAAFIECSKIYIKEQDRMKTGSEELAGLLRSGAANDYHDSASLRMA